MHGIEEMTDLDHFYEHVIPELYGPEEYQRSRYQSLVHSFMENFDSESIHFISSPGRTEIGGNHTDHNNGRVLAASINLDSVAAVSINDSDKIILRSEGFNDPIEVDLRKLERNEEEKGNTTSLIRGIAYRFVEFGYNIGGFQGCMTSDVLPGSGLSSSASVEVLIGSIFNYLFNEGRIFPEKIAQAGQYAENKYFGKPCGLMDQMACAVGGIVSIDFKDPGDPQVEKIDFDFEPSAYRLVIVNTGGSHADLTRDYSAIPEEMKAAAGWCGGVNMRDIEREKYMHMIPEMRKAIGDRAVLRGLHFLAENERVPKLVETLRKGELMVFLRLIRESGDSSFKWLQNIYSVKNSKEQGMALALAITDDFIKRNGGTGACRVHGGGFAGTIQTFLPESYIRNYVEEIERVFGQKSALALNIRNVGMHYFGEFLLE